MTIPAILTDPLPRMTREQPTYRPVTAQEVRQHGLCKGKHKGMGYWRLFCGCMTHPAGVSVVQLLGTWVWRGIIAVEEKQ